MLRFIDVEYLSFWGRLLASCPKLLLCPLSRRPTMVVSIGVLYIQEHLCLIGPDLPFAILHLPQQYQDVDISTMRHPLLNHCLWPRWPLWLVHYQLLTKLSLSSLGLSSKVTISAVSSVSPQKYQSNDFRVPPTLFLFSLKSNYSDTIISFYFSLISSHCNLKHVLTGMFSLLE